MATVSLVSTSNAYRYYAALKILPARLEAWKVSTSNAYRCCAALKTLPARLEAWEVVNIFHCELEVSTLLTAIERRVGGNRLWRVVLSYHGGRRTLWGL